MTQQFDTVVIGAGLAGLTTAIQSAQQNKKTLLVATGIGALLLTSGCVDVLGFQSAPSREPIANPLDKLPAFLADQPHHPYHLIGREKIKSSLNQFVTMVNQIGLDYQHRDGQNWFLPSPAGAVHPTYLAPKSLTQGDITTGGSMLLVGFHELRDFYPHLISKNLNAQDLGITSTPHKLNLPTTINATNITPLELARVFEQAEFRQQLAVALSSVAKGYDRIGFPAVLGLQQHRQVLADLTRRVGKPIFEISTLPPSVPGRRLFDGLRNLFQQAGGRLIIGSRVTQGKIEQGMVSEIVFQTSNRPKTISAKHYIMATGSLFGGGLETDMNGRIWEPIFNLPVASESNRHVWFAEKFISQTGHPISHYGIKVNERFNPVDETGQVIATNLYIAGATLAGYDWTQGRTGEGVTVTSAMKIAEQLN
ncbi:anaerobic glycerol-3-phosphate dehydrogenase subunit GlpB [Anaerolineales bacterium HSG6]|nr:anaerobic glycerol-3-phosphate dehydrogenase subunit GlpB [Anaerolineales bacterium HSG6]